MDDKTAYEDLRRNMQMLLAYINAADRKEYGACIDEGSCTMTTEADCPTRNWQSGVECLVDSDPHTDYARAAQELHERMERLLDQGKRTGQLLNRAQGTTFELGGKTYRLEMILQEVEVVSGAGKAVAAT